MATNKQPISFTKEVKNEVSNLTERNVSENLALLSAFTKINSSLILRGKEWGLVLHSENQKTAKLILGLIHSIFHVECNVAVVQKKHFTKPGNDTIIQIEVMGNVKNILSSLQLYNEKLQFNSLPNYDFLRNNDVKRAYLSGAFLASGSINSPETSNYHLEVALNNDKQADLIINQLHTFYIEAKKTSRRNQVVIYLKKSEQIADFLRVLGASQSLLKFENVRIQRDQYNSVNRVNNCDLANLNKAVTNGLEQQKKIQLIVKKMGIENLPPIYQDLARIRLEHPEYSLADLVDELQEVAHVQMTKSGIYYRLHKIEEIADRLRGDEDE